MEHYNPFLEQPQKAPEIQVFRMQNFKQHLCSTHSVCKEKRPDIQLFTHLWIIPDDQGLERA